jgi:hypothetical protein
VVRLIYAYVFRLGATTIRKRMVGVKVKLAAFLYSKLGIETMSSLRTFLKEPPILFGYDVWWAQSGSRHSGYDKKMTVSV